MLLGIKAGFRSVAVIIAAVTVITAGGCGGGERGSDSTDSDEKSGTAAQSAQSTTTFGTTATKPEATLPGEGSADRGEAVKYTLTSLAAALEQTLGTGHTATTERKNTVKCSEGTVSYLRVTSETASSAVVFGGGLPTAYSKKLVTTLSVMSSTDKQKVPDRIDERYEELTYYTDGKLYEADEVSKTFRSFAPDLFRAGYLTPEVDITALTAESAEAFRQTDGSINSLFTLSGTYAPSLFGFDGAGALLAVNSHITASTDASGRLVVFELTFDLADSEGTEASASCLLRLAFADIGSLTSVKLPDDLGNYFNLDRADDEIPVTGEDFDSLDERYQTLSPQSITTDFELITAGHPAGNLFDGCDGYVNLTDNVTDFEGSGTANGQGSISFACPGSLLRAYAFVFPSDAQPDSTPNGWVLYGSRDNESWSVIDRVDGGGTDADGCVPFGYIVDAPATFDYYRFTFTSTVEGEPLEKLCLAEIFLYTDPAR